MSKKYIKNYSTSIAIRKRMTLRLHFTSVRMTITKETNETKKQKQMVARMQGKRELIATAG
jgi:hypothetical protein